MLTAELLSLSKEKKHPELVKVVSFDIDIRETPGTPKI
jgi:hypothetical protein